MHKISLGISTYWQAISALRQQYDPAKIKSVQNLKLQKLLHYAAKNIKYYRELFEAANINPGQIKSTTDLQQIPVLTKQELRSRFWDFLPRQLPPCRLSRTSGSTGTPVCLLSDQNSRCFNSAAVIRCRKTLGIPIVGRPILTPLKNKNEPPKTPHWTYLQGIHKTYYVNPYSESDEDRKYANAILSSLKKPALIGITPAVRKLAYCIKDSVLPPIKPCIVMTTGEVLTAQVRKLIESTFHAAVADVYACNEAGDVAWQCTRGNGYHINFDNVIVEIYQNGKPAPTGQVGEVLITNLNRYVMPIIRYKNGDLARLSTRPCPCGSKLPVLSEIVGRTGEDIILPNGKEMPWNQLKTPMNHPHIRQFQLIQNTDGSFLIKYVKEPYADKISLEQLIFDRYRKLLGDFFAVKAQSVKKIDLAPSGKSNLVVSYYKRI